MPQRPLNPVKKGFGKKHFNRIIRFMNRNRVLPIRPGWQQTNEGIIPPPIPEPGTLPPPRKWGLVVTDPEENLVEIRRPGTLKKFRVFDDSALVTIAGIETTFTAQVGQWLVLHVTPDLTTELIQTAEWTGYPTEVTTEEQGGLFVVTDYYYPLWKFVNPEDANQFAITVSDTISAEPYGYDSDLMFVNTILEDAAGNVVPAWTIEPAQPCATS